MLIAICVLLILADQAVKHYISAAMPLGASVPVFPGIFHITLVHNPGAAFGVLANQRGLFIVFSIVLVLAMAFFYRRLLQESFSVRYGAFLLLGGAMGNLIDRVRYGYVVDFFDFRIWPVFNVADIAIVCGVGLLMYAVIFEMKETEG